MPVLSTHDELRSVLADSQTPTLFVSPGVQRWGRYDFNRLALEQHDKQQPGDDELLDLATAQTLRHDGTEVNGRGCAKGSLWHLVAEGDRVLRATYHRHPEPGVLSTD